MTEREALKQLLEALDKELPHNMKHIAAGQRFNARTALAQPEQEPVAWYYEIDGSKAISFAKDGEPNKPWQGLYTQPDPDALHAAYMSGVYDGKKLRTWVGLTDEDKAELDEKYGDDTLAHLDALEAKLKEKNT